MGMNLAVAGINHQPFMIRVVNETIEQGFPQPFVSPATKASMRIFPIAVDLGQVPPGCASPQNPEDAIDEASVVMGNPAPLACLAGQMRLQKCPEVIRNVVALGQSRHWEKGENEELLFYNKLLTTLSRKQVICSGL